MLRIEGLHVRYGAIHAVKGIGLTVRPGTIATLIGANGAGKTTTLRTISGLLRASAGVIEFEGEAIQKLPRMKSSGAASSTFPKGGSSSPTCPSRTTSNSAPISARTRPESAPIARRSSISFPG